METITHRELRNNSGEILRRVAAGESIQISNNGRVAAVISPVQSTTLDELVAQGQARPARKPLSTLRDIAPKEYPISSRELIEQSRGHW